MTNELTDFEAYIKSQYQGVDLTIFDRAHWQCQLVVLETNYTKEFELFVDNIASRQEDDFVSNYFKSRVRLKHVFDNHSDSILIASYKELIKETLDNICDYDVEAKDYDFQPDNSEQPDGSYQAKQCQEIQRMG